MGWLRALEQAQRQDTVRKRKRPPLPTTTAEERIDDRLRQQARRLNIRIKDYIRNGELNVDALQDEIVRRTEARRQGKKDEKEEEEEVPDNVDPDAWHDAKDDPVEQDRLIAEAAVTASTSGPLTGVPDTFNDAEYNAMGGHVQDSYQLDMNLPISPQQYRAKILFEDRNVRTGVTGRHLGRHGWGGLSAKGTPVRTSAQAYIARVMRMDVDELTEFQHDLYAAGFYGSAVGERDEEPVWGVPDEPTKNAVHALSYMTLSYKGTKSILEVLDMFRARVDTDGDGIPDSIAKEEADKPKPVISLTSKVDLAQQAQDESVDLMGRRLSEGEVGGTIGGYNSLESTYQYGSQMAQINNEAGTFTAPPTPGAYAENELRRTHGAEVDSYTYLKNINHLLEMVGLG
jgi:hypothetical protein